MSRVAGQAAIPGSRGGGSLVLWAMLSVQNMNKEKAWSSPRSPRWGRRCLKPQQQTKGLQQSSWAWSSSLARAKELSDGRRENGLLTLPGQVCNREVFGPLKVSKRSCWSYLHWLETLSASPDEMGSTELPGPTGTCQCRKVQRKRHHLSHAMQFTLTHITLNPSPKPFAFTKRATRTCSFSLYCLIWTPVA